MLDNKLPSWIGSILFHALVILFLLYWFASGPDRSAPGERTAVGSIVLHSGGHARQQTETSADTHSDDNDTIAAELDNWSNVSASLVPATPALAPGLQHMGNTGTDSAIGMTQSFQGLSGSAGIGDGAITVHCFGTQGKGTKFMYVFDRSGSMEGVPIRKAKEELIRSLNSLGDFHQFNIVFYSGEYQLWRPGRRLIHASPTNKHNAAQFVEGMTASGGTNHYPPLKEALDHRPDVIFFLTDGDSQDDPTLRLGDIERANRVGRGVQINVIQFGRGGLIDAPSQTLQRLAEQNHGEYIYVNVMDWR